ncbi:MAG: cysteine--tRNA ligase [Bacteroidales bacterium]|nr:cysteine--tRNA ligase [Bacteroidota bacterium]MBL6950237.1 cysteine--tRNA ligase [Bacteroidales bacterium]
MKHNLTVYNTLTRKKELFKPLKEPFAGMYVCGPTVYGDPHLGHARPAIVFDLVFRYLKHLGYKVRYVRNITDVGHLEQDLDEGEDKIAKKARLEKIEPMEVVQYYSDRYYHFMELLNVERPSIEPRASGHIIEQISMIERILKAGYGYVVNGSVYFDVEKYNKSYHYGKLSGRKLEDLIANTRELEGQAEKRNPVDFALWKKAPPDHIMRWSSPWSEGFPGWHLECSAMGTKYLGEEFDIHGGGMDLLFPHHEGEIAQSRVANGKDAVRYWLHNNMITINGKKMGKSLGNAVTLEELFSGKHPLLEQAYSPMTIRFFILQAHYRSTLDFSNEALRGAEKGLKRLMTGIELLNKLSPSENNQDPGSRIKDLVASCYAAMNDDFNSPVLIANLFDGLKMIYALKEGKMKLTTKELMQLKELYDTYVFDILGLKDETSADQSETVDELMNMIIKMRKNARDKKEWDQSDQIRDELAKLGINIKDTNEGATWEKE